MSNRKSNRDRPKVSPGAPQPAKTKTGWYMNDKGEVCYEGRCFGVRSNLETGDFDFSFDEECDVELASQAERALMKNMLNGRGVTYSRRRKKNRG